MLIRKVWLHKGTKQLIVTIPRNLTIGKGDYVEIKKVKKVIP